MAKQPVVDFEDVRIFPTVGKMRVTFKHSDGKTTELTFDYSKLDHLAQKLLVALNEARSLSADHQQAFTISEQEIEGPIEPISQTRTIPVPQYDGVVLQAVLQSGGLRSLLLPTPIVTDVLNQLQQSLTDTQTLKRPMQ